MKLNLIVAYIGIALSFMSFANHGSDHISTAEPEPFFSLAEINHAAKKSLAAIEQISATDGIGLAYRAYRPPQPQAVLIFYHGAGAHSGLSYNHIGVDLSGDFAIAVYMPDIRGHGASAGDRGDSPSVEQVWADTKTMVELARQQHPNLPIFMGGHSAGAGLALNYSSWDQRAEVDGYVFLAPYFGFRSETDHDNNANNGFEFSTVKTSRFIINAISGGLLLGHSKAVMFNFPDAVLQDHPEIVPFNTVNMSKAVTPHAPDAQLAKISPFGLWIGQQDEAFDPVKVTLFAQQHSGKKANKVIKTVESENHFSIILAAADLIGPWIKSINER
ncbi:alpha/beta hydrolase [uncultured Ferrimonas sp.]|uniref:alpha/beta fold hydrolase n=1 Tax=uncultured Ferrimonas sp. TaxID=432640 RepID=UPI0026082073|nr:alpha/beta hydrolase [uncultured Ferrimonas sp.]